jgi:lia operon protein LiaG
MVTQEDRDDIWIKYHGTIKSNIVPKLETERNGKVLNIKLMSDKNSYTVSESNVILEISVPESFNKDFSISSSSADIFVNDIAGLHFDLNSGSGDIKLNNLSGKSANIITSSGDLILAELNCNSSIDSSSGDIKLYADNSSKDLKIATSSGDVVVVFEDGANYSVMCTASSGDVFTDRDISINKYKGNRYEFKEGTGDNEMRIDTSSGDIYFK